MCSLLNINHLRRSLKCLPSLKREHFFKQNQNLPAIQSFATKPNTTNPNNKSEWRIIYRLPLISLASAFNRVKLPFGVLSGIIIPTTFVLEQFADLPLNSGLVATAVCVSLFGTLAICSSFARSLVGIIYINNNNEKLKLAYIDYWGKRREVCIDLDDIIPESEQSSPAKLKIYQLLRLYSDDKVKYVVLHKYGRIEDYEIFCSIFGEIK